MPPRRTICESMAKYVRHGPRISVFTSPNLALTVSYARGVVI